MIYLFKRSVFLFFAVTLLLTSCKKDDIKKQHVAKTNDTNEDNGTDDNVSIFAISIFSKPPTTTSNTTGTGQQVPCGADAIEEIAVDTLPDVVGPLSNTRIRLTFNGLVECFESDATILKQGAIILQMTKGSNWKDAGAQITITYANYKETRKSSGNPEEVITYAGTKVITNVSGGISEGIAIGDSVVHTIRTHNMTLTYPDKTKRIENASERVVAKKHSATEVEFSVTGDGAYNGMANIAIWGTQRDGSAFYGSFITPKVYNTCSGAGKFISGRALFHKGEFVVEDTYGVDNMGTPVNNCGAYGYLDVLTKTDGSQIRKVYPY